MSTLLERLLPLWTEPVDGRDDAEAALGEVYADPVVVNGTEMGLTAVGLQRRAVSAVRSCSGNEEVSRGRGFPGLLRWPWPGRLCR
jgi:hypothetical protein